MLLLAGLVAATFVGSGLDAGEPLRYWGTQEAPSTGWLDTGRGALYEVRVGSEIPGWGRVKEVHADHIVLERILTEDDKRALREQGALVHDAYEIHLPREDLRHPDLTVPHPPSR